MKLFGTRSVRPLERGRSARRCLSGVLAGLVAFFTMFTMLPSVAGAAKAAAAKSGGTLNVVMPGSTSSWDPAVTYITGSYDGPMMTLLYGGLCFNTPKTGALQMYMAQSLTPSQDGKVWTLVLHPNMKFSDGTPYDAASVEYNIQRDLDPAIGSLQAALASSFTMNVVNPTTLTMTLKKANDQFNSYFCNAFTFDGSPTAEKAEGFPAFGQHPVAPGPFLLKNVVQNVSVTYVKNPLFSSFAPGQPYLDGVNIQVLGPVTQQESALTTGAVQLGLYSAGTSQIVNYLKSQSGISVTSFTIGGAAVWYFNTSAAPFNSLQARQAVYYAENRAAEANANSPQSQEATNLFPSTSPFYNKKLNFPDQDSVKAQKLFDAYAAQNGGPLTFSVMIPSGSAVANVGAAYLQSELSAYKNVVVKINPLPQNLYEANIKDGNYQAANGAPYVVAPIPTYVNLFQTGGSANYMKWSDPAVDKALAGLADAKTPAAQKQIWNTVASEFNKQLPYVPKNANTFAYATKTGAVKGLVPINFGTSFLWGQVSLANP